MTLMRTAMLAATLVLLHACAERDEPPPAARDSQEHVWKNQTEAMERAREVERVLQEQAERRRRELEKQGG